MICMPAITEQELQPQKLFDEYFEYKDVEFGYKRLFFRFVKTKQNIFNIPKGSEFEYVTVTLASSTIYFHSKKDSFLFNLSLRISK